MALSSRWLLFQGGVDERTDECTHRRKDTFQFLSVVGLLVQLFSELS